MRKIVSRFKDKLIDSFPGRYLEYRRWSHMDQQRYDFYAQFITSDSLVFDVGANYGNRAKIFLKRGARVIAFEPQQRCSNFLRIVNRSNDKFGLEVAALGESPGEALLNISNVSPLSSISESWIQKTQESGRFAHYSWNSRQRVTVSTLELMIERYGLPDFVKIDVEGYELNVLKGLSSPVEVLSFEFTPEIIETAVDCLHRLGDLSNYVYQVSFGESMTFHFDDWVDLETALNFLRGYKGSGFGDIYARREAA